MCERLNKFWERVKALFGRSKIVFVNIIGAILAAYVELQDFLISFNWDDVFKHEVAVAIGFGTQIMSVIFRVYSSSGPTSFSATPASSVEPVTVPADVEAVPSPKAE